MEISAIIPCYNFRKKIIKNIILLDKILKKNFVNYEIIIINESSDDGTKSKLNNFKKDKRIKIIHNNYNKGKSYSVLRGMRKATGNKIFLYDCDLPYYSYLNMFLKKLKKNQFVIIDRKNKKSRLIKKNITSYQKVRHLIGTIISHIVCLFIGINTVDTQSGMKGFINTNFLRKNKFISQRFFLDIEIINLFKKNKIHPVKIPVKYEIPRNSTIRLFDIKNFEILIELCKVLTSLNIPRITQDK